MSARQPGGPKWDPGLSRPDRVAARLSWLGSVRAVRLRPTPDLRFVPDLVVSDGEYVAGRWTMTGTNTGSMDLFGLPPTGRPVKMTG